MPKGGAALQAAEPKKKDTLFSVSFFLVEAGGVEPPSENVLTGTSPGADGLLRFPSQSASRHALRVGSFMVHGALKALRTHGPH